MAGSEQGARREAVRRVMAGEAVAAVAASMGRSKPWVRKWVARYDPTDPAWAAERSRAPGVVANRTDAETEALVVKVRQRLADQAWAQTGPAAIAWELTRLGEDPPDLRTIARILARHDQPRRGQRRRYQPRGTPYPTPPQQAPNACQQADLVGPRHLDGGACFYAVNAVDVARRKAGGAITAAKSAPAVCGALLAIWQQLGLPTRVQLDNQQGLAGAGRQPGAVVRFCLAHGVTPVFIPFAEPWRNGVVEHYNDTFDKSFSPRRALPHPRPRRRPLPRLPGLSQRPAPLLRPRRAHPRPGRGPGRLRPHLAPPRPGRARALRRAHRPGGIHPPDPLRRHLRVLGHDLAVPDELIYTYVTAVLDVAAHQLTVHYHDVEVTRFPFPLK